MMKTERGEVSEKANASNSGLKIFPARIAAQDSFKRQIILTFVVGFCLLAIAFTSYQVVSERSYLYGDNTDETTSLAESLAAGSRSWVLANDVAGLQEVVRSFQSHPELRYAIIISPSGKVLANTDATKVGQFLSDELSLSLIKSQPVKRIMIDNESMSDIAVPIMIDHRHIGWARVAQGREEISGNLHKMMLNSGLFVVVAFLFSLFAALLIAKRLGYRIGYLMRVAEEVQAGNYATRTNISGDDEFARLGSSLNHMLDVLARDEERLRESEALFRNMFAKHTAIMFIVEPHTGEILDANKAAEVFYGYPTSRLCTMNIDDFNMLPPDQVLQEREKALHSERNYFVFPHRLANGTIRTVEVHSSPITLESRQVLFSIIHDITEREQAEFVLRQSEEALKEAQRMAHVGSWYMDLATNEVVWSEVLYQIYGFDPALPPPLYTESMKLFTPESWERLSTSIARAVETGISYELELEMVSKDGGRKWMLARGELVRDASGVPVRVRGVVMDITERKLADIEIREKEERLALATINNGVGIWDWNLQTQQMIWDDSMFTLYHIHREDFIGTEEAWRASLHPDDLERGDQEVADAISGKKPFETEFRVVWPNGEIRYIKAVAKVFRDDQGVPLRMLGINMDVTDRKMAEMELRESEDKFKYVFDHSPIGKTLTLPTGELQVNKSFCEMLGYSEEELGHTRWQDITHPDDIELTQSSIDRILSGEWDSARFIKRYLHKNGSVLWVEIVTSLRRDNEGNPLHFMTSIIDITERKRAEEELLERESHSQSLLRLSRNMERSQTYNEVLNAAQDEVKKIIGYQSLWVYLLSDDKQYLKAIVATGTASDTVMSEEGTATLTIKGDRMLEEIAASKEIVLVEDARTDDRVNKEIVESMGNRTILNIPILLFDRHLGTVGTGTFGDEGVRVPSSSEQKYLIAMASHMAVALDRIHLLAERRKAESELRELNNDFVTLLENTGDFIYFKDQESRIRFCSQTLANVAGHSSWRDMVGKHDLEVFPKDVARVYYEEELPIFRDGKALVNKTDPYYDAQGKPGWVNTNKWPVFGADKKTVVGIFGISRDITELKQAEDKIIELNRDLESKVVERTEQLEAANKELESFSYSVSHDLRSPLRAIDGFSHILQEDYTDKLDDEGKRLLGVVRDNTQKMGRLIDDILAFSRTGRGGLSFAEIDMEGMAHAVVGELLSDTGGLVEIEHIPPARGDRAMMHQVFVNLLSNAIKFSHLKEHAMIKVGASVEDEETIYFVRDNGAGFDMHYAEKLFGVFQRLHAVSEFEGTGIGLAIVKRIVTRHGGRVWAEGKVNEGATFYFALPTPTSIDRETS